MRILYGYDPVRQVITGIGVISMRETPGIGDKILTDADFLRNFTAVDVHLTTDLQSLANAVKTVKHGTKSSPWQIDAIAGATVTSKAIGRGINESARTLLPRLLPHLERLNNNVKKEEFQEKGKEGREKGEKPGTALSTPFPLPPSRFSPKGVLS